MNSKIKYLPINWTNGMSLSDQHFNAQYMANADAIRDAISLQINDYNYGLLGGTADRHSAVSIETNINEEKVEVVYCRAVTRNGSRIEILNQTWQELQCTMSELISSENIENSDFWYVLLSINIFSRIPEGDAANNVPRKQPFTRPVYQLELIAEEDLKRDGLSSAIPVAKFRYTNSGLRKVEEYIPPCARLNSHKKLITKSNTYHNFINTIKTDTLEIVKKIKRKKQHHREHNNLADDVDTLCKSYLEYIASSYDEYRLTFKELPPIKLVEFFAKMARIFNHSMEMAYSKQQMLAYFGQYATEFNAAELDGVVKRAMEVDYTHKDIAASLYVIDRFIETFAEIFDELKALDFKELVPRNVVIDDKYSDGDDRYSGGKIPKPEPTKPRDGGRIKIKAKDGGGELGSDLQD